MLKIDKRIYLALLAVLIFFIPSNLFFKFLVPTGYVNGLLIDYLIPKIYFSECILLLLLGLWSIENFRLFHVSFLKKYAPFFFLFFVLFLRQFFAIKPLPSVLDFIRIVEALGLIFFLVKEKWVIMSKVFFMSWCCVLVFQSLLAIAQFQVQHSVFPSYLFFGETRLANQIDIAKNKIGFEEKILPYGTTAHPNILAGFLVIGVLILLQSVSIGRNRKFFIFLGVTILSFIALLLAQSISAWLCLLFGVIYIKWRPHWSQRHQKIYFFCAILFILFSPFFLHFLAKTFTSNTSFLRRDDLNTSAIHIIERNSLFGVGLQNFTAHIEEYSPTAEAVRFMQPVHNIFLLWVSETGLIGILLFVFLAQSFRKKNVSAVLFCLFPIMIFDHYLLTQETGLLLVSFFIFGCIMQKKEEKICH